jgi:hypothetical protein
VLATALKEPKQGCQQQNANNIREINTELKQEIPATTGTQRSKIIFSYPRNFIRQRLPDSASQRIVNSPTRQVGESATCRLTDVEIILFKIHQLTRRVGDSPSRRVGDSPTHRRGDFSFKNSLADSPTRRVGETATPRLGELGSSFSITNISENTKPKSEPLER